MDDLISRQAVLETLDDMDNVLDEDRTIENYKELLKECYEVLPPVRPQEPKTVLYSGDGYANGYMVYDMAECPNCGRKFEYGDETWNCNFCPDCGQALNWERSE